VSDLDKRTEFLLWVTKFMHGHWEDPEWGRRVTSQVMYKQAIHEIAENIENPEMRKQIQNIVGKEVKTH